MKKYFAFTFLLFAFSFQTWALDPNNDPNCDQVEGLPSKVVPKWVPQISWWGATSKDVKNAACKTTRNLSDEELENYFSTKYPAGQTQAYFAGINLQNENPAFVEMLRKLTQIPERKPGSICVWCRNPSEQKIYNIPSDCKSVLCAAKAAFGEKEGLRMLYLMDRFGFNSSADIYKDSSPWKAKELDVAISSMEDMPSFMFPLDPNQKFTHYTRGTGQGRGNLEIIANASMEFYSGFDKLESDEVRTYTFVHEWGHNVGSDLKIDSSKEWLNLSGWVDKGGDWTLTNPKAVVSNYAKTNPSEDFAESVATYRYNPQLLLAVNPEKYQFLKEVVFQGVEYLDGETCQEQNAYVNKIFNSEREWPNPVIDLSHFKDCRNEIFSMISATTTSALDTCMQNTVTKERLDSGMQDFASLKNFELVKKGVSMYNWDKKRIGLNEEAAIKAKSDLKERFAETLTDSFAASCKGQMSLLSTLKGFIPSIDDRCQKISQFSYRDAKELDSVFEDPYFMIRNRENYEAFVKKTCLQMDKKLLNKCQATSEMKSYILKQFP